MSCLWRFARQHLFSNVLFDLLGEILSERLCCCSVYRSQLFIQSYQALQAQFHADAFDYPVSNLSSVPIRWLMIYRFVSNKLI